MLRKVGVTPVDELAAGQDSDTLRHLVEHSATAGTLDERYRGYLVSALELEALTVGDMANPDTRPSRVAPQATPAQIQHESHRTGHLRLLVGDNGRIDGVVHVRDTVSAVPDISARELMRPVLTLDAATPVYAALRTMRETRSHLAVVSRDGQVGGLITLADVLRRLLPATEARR
jgi:CBS domain containing-hemolysin-like protein